MIIFLYGQNDFKIQEKVRELENKFIKEVDISGQNIFKYDGEKINFAETSKNLSNNSLFANKRMLIISNLIKNKEKNILKNFLEFLEKNKISSSEDIFIFTEKNLKSKNLKNLVKIKGEQESVLNKEELSFFDYLKKEKYSQEMKNFSSSELLSIIKKELDKYKFKMDLRDAQFLIAINNEDPWSLHQEIKKISSYKLGKISQSSSSQDFKISLEEIKEIASGIWLENIFAFTDAVSNKNKPMALKILEKQYLLGAEASYISTMLLRQFKILLQIRELLDLNYNTSKIISSLKLHPFIINKGINQAKNFEKEKLIKIINSIINIELENRSHHLDLKSLINLLIVKI